MGKVIRRNRNLRSRKISSRSVRKSLRNKSRRMRRRTIRGGDYCFPDMDAMKAADRYGPDAVKCQEGTTKANQWCTEQSYCGKDGHSSSMWETKVGDKIPDPKLKPFSKSGNWV